MNVLRVNLPAPGSAYACVGWIDALDGDCGHSNGQAECTSSPREVEEIRPYCPLLTESLRRARAEVRPRTRMIANGLKRIEKRRPIVRSAFEVSWVVTFAASAERASELARTYFSFSSDSTTVLVGIGATVEFPAIATVGIGTRKISTRRFSALPRAEFSAIGRNSP